MAVIGGKTSKDAFVVRLGITPGHEECAGVAPRHRGTHFQGVKTVGEIGVECKGDMVFHLYKCIDQLTNELITKKKVNPPVACAAGVPPAQALRASSLNSVSVPSDRPVQPSNALMRIVEGVWQTLVEPSPLCHEEP